MNFPEAVQSQGWDCWSGNEGQAPLWMFRSCPWAHPLSLLIEKERGEIEYWKKYRCAVWVITCASTWKKSTFNSLCKPLHPQLLTNHIVLSLTTLQSDPGLLSHHVSRTDGSRDNQQELNPQGFSSSDQSTPRKIVQERKLKQILECTEIGSNFLLAWR